MINKALCPSSGYSSFREYKYLNLFLMRP
jgi:hypothetical protein